MKVFITGITGQDGSYMADYLLQHGREKCEIYGLVRRSTKPPLENIEHILDKITLVEGDLNDSHSIDKIIQDLQPNYIINLAAQSHVHVSWKQPLYTLNTNTVAVLNLLEAIRKYSPHSRFYQASTSEMFGNVEYSPQDEAHPLKPRSIYGAAKCAAHHLVKVYRESYNLYAVSGILFNHESPRRHESFVTRKITKGIAKIFHELEGEKKITPIYLGNVFAKRDWSHALDFCDGIWKMLNQEWLIDFDFSSPHNLQIKDYVLSSSETYSVLQFINFAINAASIEADVEVVVEPYNILSQSSDEESQKNIEQYLNSHDSCPILKINGQDAVIIKREFFRPAEVELLLGCSKRARDELGWEPKYSLQNLVEEMVKTDYIQYDE